MPEPKGFNVHSCHMLRDSQLGGRPGLTKSPLHLGLGPAELQIKRLVEFHSFSSIL